MKTLNYLVCFMAISILLGACKKETSTTVNANNPQSALGGGPTIPSGAAGALYAISNNIVDVGGTTTLNTGYAWFGSYTNTQQAGVVLCSSDTLSTLVSPLTTANFPWYESSYSLFQGNELTFTGNAVPWVVTGSGSVAAFSYTDNAVWPVANFTVPSSISSSAALTVSFSITNPYDLIICSIYDGTKQQANVTLTSGTSVTFTAAQVASATTAGGETVTIQIMPIKLTSSNIGGKTYYFVKQNGFAQTTVTL